MKERRSLRSAQSLKDVFMAKVIVIGNSSVGKTSILGRYTQSPDKPYQLCHTPTIGVDFKVKYLSLPDGDIKLQLWDTAGQQRFRTMTANYYAGVSGVVLVYSITDRKSFEQISDWIYQINSKNDDNVPKIIIGNKCDISGRSNSYGEDKRVVETFEGKMIAQKYKAMFMQVSAKQNINIGQSFNLLAQKILERSLKNPPNTTNVMHLDKKKQKKQGKNCC